ncbi:LysE family translocator [Pectobacterium versatile]|uniref:LysE family translocator n=1 Tax=Pectobacterium versatile TaxID=2488639 RepID=A0ABU8K2W0_9GAMM|nr:MULTISPECIES: LysE family translocator [Pectobacterium]MBN3239388.1 LysE family translocator [Pectobacterium versatile]MBQ4764946.1 LysE family translocator [Pectobacterium versatile]MCL6336426.1 LysE family translocator [Pectobacterium carotovorum subsp. carotovorum]MCL6349319.1 LysE family translocator [Pectobacterium carotovorum subsp. carotovorum]MCL6403781.1 LysE family translocator [Pectobacterium carotovorum subsp. carotovorum]
MLDPSFFSYVTVMSITPGPNNLLLATSGVNFGLRRTLPMLMGILIGCALQTALMGVALELLLSWLSMIRLPLTVLGCVYLLWLSWKIVRSSAPELQGRVQPMTVLQGTLFQAVNPKAWLMSSNIALLYTASNGILPTMIAFMALNLPCILVWAVLGDRIGKHLQEPWKLKAFNGIMALSLVLTTFWMLAEAINVTG